MPDRGLTHLDPLGRARMVDVTPKDATHRRALARCKVFMKPETVNKVASTEITKGDVLQVARVAGIQAAKQTPHLLPLCHPLLVGSVYVNFRIEVEHVEGFRADYAQTLTHWIDRLDSNLDEARRLAGEERVRVWRLYLRAARNGFQTGFTSIYQSRCRLA